MVNRAFLLLGSNIDKEHNLPTAVRLLRQACRVIAVSSVYETVPVGLVDQPDFLNTAVLVETELDAANLKRDVLSKIEQALNRNRLPDKNAPRTIDIDLVLFNDEIFDLDQRHIPDPELQKFLHVAVPIAELAPDLPHPETGVPLAHIAANLLAEAAENGLIPPRKRLDVEVKSGK